MANGIKLLLIITLCIALLAVNVLAETSVEIPSPKTGSTFNVGDKVVITGRITLNNSVSGAKVSFSASSKTLNKNIPITTKFYSFGKDTPVTFAQINKETLVWQISSEIGVADDWKILVGITKDPKTLIVFESGGFTISKSLSVSLSANSLVLNFGEPIEISGTILNAKGEVVTGTANIFFDEKELGTIVTDAIEVSDGYFVFSYTFKTTDPQGKYNFTINALDENGNLGIGTIKDITISNKLKLACEIPKKDFNASESFTVIGKLTNIHDSTLGKIPIVAFISTPEERVSLRYDSVSDANGNYAVKVTLPKLAFPGTYMLNLQANDTFGNLGNCAKDFYVASEKKISTTVNLNNSWYYQESSMGLKLTIANEGNINLSGEVELYVDNNKVLSNAFTAEKGSEAELPLEWKVKGDEGNHTLRTILTVDGSQLYESQPLIFTIYKKPEPPKEFKLRAIHAFIIIGIIVIAFLLYIKKQDIKEYFWHLEVRKKFKK